ncbi:hypothetical protein CK203_021859 [Vitis vinifera]|uniref:Uncharacterized protein n=1 Tax=Vitis vinifera TaxID=29760 RepID=A0A438JFD0_VITVI|nr:hypothetical protein CK203_021859 [Vitis vinifera]
MGRHGILGARHIAEALQIPFEPIQSIILELGLILLSWRWCAPFPEELQSITSAEGGASSSYPSLFRREGHRKKLQRADCIPLIFPRLLCNSGTLGYPSEPQLERKRICREPFTLDKWNNMTAYKVDQPEQPQPAARRASPRHIPRLLQLLRAVLLQEMAAIRACQEQMLATQAQQAAILRQLQVHFDCHKL